MDNTVEEVAIKLKVSRQAIYNKIKLDEFKDRITIIEGRTYIDDELMESIKDSLRVNINLKKKAKAKEAIAANAAEAPESDIVNFNREFMETLLEQIRIKDQQLQEKDQHIHELNSIVNKEQDLHKNTQILFKEQLPQDQLVLEEHFQELDNKMEEVKTKMADRKEEHKSFFSKIFKGKR